MTPATVIWSWLTRTDRRDAVICGLGLAGLGGAMGQPLGALPALAVLGSASLAIARIDSRRQLIPDLLTLAVALAGLAHPAPAPVSRILVALVVLALFLGLRWAAGRALGRTALGAGDVKLIAAAALWLDWQGLPTYVLAAALTGLAESLLTGRHRLAFGRHLAPWLCLMALLPDATSI